MILEVEVCSNLCAKLVDKVVGGDGALQPLTTIGVALLQSQTTMTSQNSNNLTAKCINPQGNRRDTRQWISLIQR